MGRFGGDICRYLNYFNAFPIGFKPSCFLLHAVRPAWFLTFWHDLLERLEILSGLDGGEPALGVLAVPVEEPEAPRVLARRHQVEELARRRLDAGGGVGGGPVGAAQAQRHADKI